MFTLRVNNSRPLHAPVAFLNKPKFNVCLCVYTHTHTQLCIYLVVLSNRARGGCDPPAAAVHSERFGDSGQTCVFTPSCDLWVLTRQEQLGTHAFSLFSHLFCMRLARQSPSVRNSCHATGRSCLISNHLSSVSGWILQRCLLVSVMTDD